MGENHVLDHEEELDPSAEANDEQSRAVTRDPGPCSIDASGLAHMGRRRELWHSAGVEPGRLAANCSHDRRSRTHPATRWLSALSESSPDGDASDLRGQHPGETPRKPRLAAGRYFPPSIPNGAA